MKPNDKEPKFCAHVVGVEILVLTLSSTDKIVSEKLDIDDNASKLDQILTRLRTLEENSKKDDNEKAVLLVDNAKMAAEIDHLKFSISMLRENKIESCLSLITIKMFGYMSIVRINPRPINRNQQLILIL